VQVAEEVAMAKVRSKPSIAQVSPSTTPRGDTPPPPTPQPRRDPNMRNVVQKDDARAIETKVL
jgi:hypothetical protein